MLKFFHMDHCNAIFCLIEFNHHGQKHTHTHTLSDLKSVNFVWQPASIDDFVCADRFKVSIAQSVDSITTYRSNCQQINMKKRPFFRLCASKLALC